MDLETQRIVEDLHARYVHALDADRLEDWPGFFTENGLYRIATAENEELGRPLAILYADSRAMLLSGAFSTASTFWPWLLA